MGTYILPVDLARSSFLSLRPLLRVKPAFSSTPPSPAAPQHQPFLVGLSTSRKTNATCRNPAQQQTNPLPTDASVTIHHPATGAFGIHRSGFLQFHVPVCFHCSYDLFYQVPISLSPVFMRVRAIYLRQSPMFSPVPEIWAQAPAEHINNLQAKNRRLLSAKNISKLRFTVSAPSEQGMRRIGPHPLYFLGDAPDESDRHCNTRKYRHYN
jgi:hypothetical protein